MLFFFKRGKGKKLRRCTKHDSSLIIITLRRISLNHSLHFLTGFLETKALVTVSSINTAPVLYKAFKSDQSLKAAWEGLKNKLCFHLAVAISSILDVFQNTMQGTHFGKAFLPFLYHLCHLPDTVPWCTWWPSH